MKPQELSKMKMKTPSDVRSSEPQRTMPFTRSALAAHPSRLTRSGPGLLMAAALMWLTGCASMSVPVTHPDVVDLSTNLPSRQFTIPLDLTMPKVRLALAQVSCAVAITGRKSEFEEVVRGQMTELLSGVENFVLVNRAVSAEAQAEWQLAAKGAANPATVIKSPGATMPEYLIKVTVTQVEREIRSNGARGEWGLLITATRERERREGAIELMLEAVDLATMETRHVLRAHGLLYDEKKSSGTLILGIGDAKTEATRVPESQAIRAACEQAVRQLHERFRSNH